MKKTLLIINILIAFLSNAQLINNSLVVPEFGNGTIKTYFPTTTSTIASNSNYTINLNSLPSGLATTGSPNCVAMFGSDLFVSITGDNQRIYKFPNYGMDPINAIANVSQITNIGVDYVGIAFDAAGNLFVSEGVAGFDTHIVKYTVASNYATRIDLGNGGPASFFANVTFDSAGNLWATDYRNNRIIAIEVANLNTTNATFRSCSTNSTTWIPSGGTEGNNDAVMGAKIIHLAFSQPEGIAFDSNGYLWVANNNDGSSGALTNEAPTLVRITPYMQNQILTNPTYEANPNLTNSINGYRVWNLPSSVSGRGQFGGMQIDKAIDRIYVNEQKSGSGMWFDIATIADVTDNFSNYQLAITSTNPGNGGIYLAPSSQVLGINNHVTNPISLKMYPNPSNGNFRIDGIENIKTVKVFDVLGKEIYLTKISENQYQINNKGIYIVKIETENGETLTKKIIIN